MKLFFTVEAQNCTENGLAKILKETIDALRFLTLEPSFSDRNKYGTEFQLISIIPSCMDDDFWNAVGWKERKQVLRKKGEADIRLRMDYNRFITETPENKRLMFVDIIIRSIEVVQERSKGDFKGDKLIHDILGAMDISLEQLQALKS